MPMASFRFFEILPGALSWLTLFLMVFLSWYAPAFVAVFIILFDIYWLLKTIYLSLHLRSAFSIMKKNLKINWLDELRKLQAPGAQLAFGDWQDIYHLVILPMYREPYVVVKESFERLAAANYPKEKLLVVLATEEDALRPIRKSQDRPEEFEGRQSSGQAGGEASETAERIEKEFGQKFSKFLITVHPSGLPKEIPGKGSNETWAGKEAKEKILDKFGIEYDKVLVSVFDVDTQIYPDYFGRLTYVFLKSENRMRAIYQPIPLFINNIYQAPALARVISFSSTFWQMMQQSRPERLTSFSSQSVPFRALLDVGFWQTNVVSEDSRIFWQGYLRYHGDFRVEPLFYPVSMDANAAPGFWETMKNNYRQHRRWAWGCENIPYLLDGFGKDPLIPKRKKWYWSFNTIEGFHSWATNALMIFALGWLPVLLGGDKFGVSLLSYSLPSITRFIVGLSMVGMASAAILGILLLPPRPEPLRLHQHVWYFVQWLLLPFTLIIFGCFPALESQTRMMLGGKWRLGFWTTPKTRPGS
ncbi:MAG: glycosyltransferase family 2 protein [Candidatus Liptonbacteria bacterium]|nr:glycosyltransferase family 2 protein [Candidatus Liptonbacteria bacterium]